MFDDDDDDKLLLQNGWLDKSLYKEKLTKYQIAFAKILKLKKQF